MRILMEHRVLWQLAVGLCVLPGLTSVATGKKPPGQAVRESPLDQLIRSLEAGEAGNAAPPSPGSLYSENGRLGNLARDLRAAQLHDIVTIVVADRASAVSKGSTTSARKSESRAGIASLAGPVRASGPLGQLANLGGQTRLDGQGETSRESVLETTISARVTHVLPNGYLVVEGSKEVLINSERQKVSIRGLVRWNDLTPGNRVSSDRLSDLEVRVEGKGVVQDAIRRPHFLYRLLNGLLPF
jgi:flagellar L-ring protein precursor FlgH